MDIFVAIFNTFADLRSWCGRENLLYQKQLTMFAITEKLPHYGNDQLPAHPNAKQQRRKSDYFAYLRSTRLSNPHPIRDMGQPQTLGQEERHHDTDYSRRGTGNAVAEKIVTKTPDCLY